MRIFYEELFILWSWSHDIEIYVQLIEVWNNLLTMTRRTKIRRKIQTVMNMVTHLPSNAGAEDFSAFNSLSGARITRTRNIHSLNSHWSVLPDRFQVDTSVQNVRRLILAIRDREGLTTMEVFFRII